MSRLRPRIAAFTIAKDEPEYLPIWLRYYSRELCHSDLYVLDHGCKIGAKEIQMFGGVSVPVHNSQAFSHAWLRDVVQDFQRFLLRSYEWVIFTEADELLIPNPSTFVAGFPSLADWLTRSIQYGIRATGLEVIQKPEEPVIDWDAKHVLADRHWGRPCRLYDKTLFANRPLLYSLGFHNAIPAHGEPELIPNSTVILAHLHRADRRTCENRHARRVKMPWRPEDIAAGHGSQNRLVGAALDRWFYDDPALGPWTPLPEFVRKSI